MTGVEHQELLLKIAAALRPVAYDAALLPPDQRDRVAGLARICNVRVRCGAGWIGPRIPD